MKYHMQGKRHKMKPIEMQVTGTKKPKGHQQSYFMLKLQIQNATNELIIVKCSVAAQAPPAGKSALLAIFTRVEWI